MCLRDFIPDLIQGAATILAAFVVVVAGVKGFFQQKEYELVQRRYLEGGIDVVVAITESAMNTYFHSWSRCMQKLKKFRYDESMRTEDFSVDEFPMPPDLFALTANYRLQRIVGSGVFFEIFQSAMAFTQSACSVIRDEIPTGLKITLEAGERSRDEMIEAAMELLMDMNEKYSRFHFFVGKLQDVAMVLESRKFSLSEVLALKNNPDIKSAIKELEDYYKTELEDGSPTG